MRCPCLLLTILLNCSISRGAGAASLEIRRFAIVVGNNQPEDKTSPTLRYADDDAIATHELLLQAGVESVLLVSMDDETFARHPKQGPHSLPGVRELDVAFEWQADRIRAAAKAGEATEFLFFYSGHGDVDHGEGYVVLKGGRLSRSKLHALLARSPAKRNHVFVDACKSYYLVHSKGPGGGQRSPAVAGFSNFGIPESLKNTGFVLSTSSHRESHEWERYEGGILSHEVRSALRGAADVDGDGSINYLELAAFIDTANHAVPVPRYRPDFMVVPPEHDYASKVLNWSREPVVGLRLFGARMGHVYVENAQGDRLLDAHPAGDQILSLHVPSERPLFVRRDNPSGEFVVSNLEPTHVTSLENRPASVTGRGAADIALKQLFAAPFGRESVSHYQPVPTPPPPEALEAQNPSPDAGNSKAIGTVAGVVAIGAAIGGLTTGILAAERYYGGGGESQRDLATRNRTGYDLKVASIILFSLAGVAGATWGWNKLGDRTTLSVEPMAKNGHHDLGASVALERNF